MRFIINTIYMGTLLPLLLGWARTEAELRLEKMQDAAYDTPGMESPVPPQVILGSMGLIGGHFLIGSGILKQKKRVTFLSFLIGGVIGVAAFFISKKAFS